MSIRTRRFGVLNAGAVVILALAVGSGTLSRAQQASGSGTEAGSPRFKLLRSVSGTNGSIENGRFVVADPRTAFYVPGDKQLVFYFEWEGPAGRHRLEGVWTDPTGKVASVSAFDYDAKERRFGGQWSLPVGPGMALGSWTFDARIDGESAGRHAFQIVEGEKPADLPVGRRALSPGEAYRRLEAAVVRVDALDDSGDAVGAGLGFAVAGAQLVTAFETIDGAAKVRLKFPDGHVTEIVDLAACHRWQNWAVLRLPTGGLPVLPKSAAREWQVGDRVYSLALSPDGAVTIADSGILGIARPASVGERLTIGGGGLLRSAGAAVLNEYGDVIGMVADQTVPGDSTLPRPTYGPSATESLLAKQGVYAVPVEQFSGVADDARTIPFSQLLQDGTFTRRLGPGRVHIARATTSQGVQKEPNWINPTGETAEFPRSATSFSVVLNLKPRTRIRLVANCQVLDVEGRKLAESKPLSIKADVKNATAYAWQIPTTNAPPGLYRVEIVFDGVPVWRTFIRIAQ